VQEVRDATDTAVGALLELINADQDAGEQYAVIESERFGSTTSKESYAWFHREDMLSGSAAESWVADTANFPERSPHSVSWTTTIEGFDALTFEAIVMHMDPDAVVEEMKALGTVVTAKMAEAPATKNLIVMGDFNADCGYLPGYKRKCIRGEPNNRDDCEDYLTELWAPEALEWLIDDDVDTTTSATDCAYDRIIVSSALGAKVVEGSAMPYKFDAALGLSMEDAKVVSDHYPVEMDIVLQRSDGGGDAGADSAEEGKVDSEGRPCSSFTCNTAGATGGGGGGGGGDASSAKRVMSTTNAALAAIFAFVISVLC